MSIQILEHKQRQIPQNRINIPSRQTRVYSYSNCVTVRKCIEINIPITQVLGDLFFRLTLGKMLAIFSQCLRVRTNILFLLNSLRGEMIHFT